MSPDCFISLAPCAPSKHALTFFTPLLFYPMANKQALRVNVSNGAEHILCSTRTIPFRVGIATSFFTLHNNLSDEQILWK